MDFPIIRSARGRKPHAVNEISSVTNGFSYRRPHTPEKDLPGAEKEQEQQRWIVQSMSNYI